MKAFKMPKPQYTQKFRKEWLHDPALQNWLIEKKKGSGETLPQCKFCQCSLDPELSDLKAYVMTKKNKISATYTALSTCCEKW